MPEILEVETARALLDARALDRKITKVHAPDAWFLKRGLTPPAVRTDMTSAFDESGISAITTEDLVNKTLAALRAGKREIRPGQSSQLALMRRLAPNFINRQLWKASKALFPAAAA